MNGIPLKFDLRAQFVDKNDVVLCDVFNPNIVELEGAEVALNPANNLYTASTPKQTLVEIPIDQNLFNSLLNTAKIRINASLNTSETNNPTRKRVAIQSTDKLDIRVWAKLKPTYDLNIDLGGTGDSDTTGNKKGGAR